LYHAVPEGEEADFDAADDTAGITNDDNEDDDYDEEGDYSYSNSHYLMRREDNE
jgi:hypothetical protein